MVGCRYVAFIVAAGDVAPVADIVIAGDVASAMWQRHYVVVSCGSGSQPTLVG